LVSSTLLVSASLCLSPASWLLCASQQAAESSLTGLTRSQLLAEDFSILVWLPLSPHGWFHRLLVEVHCTLAAPWLMTIQSQSALATTKSSKPSVSVFQHQLLQQPLTRSRPPL